MIVGAQVFSRGRKVTALTTLSPTVFDHTKRSSVREGVECVRLSALANSFSNRYVGAIVKPSCRPAVESPITLWTARRL